MNRPLRVGIVTYGIDRPHTGIARYVTELIHGLAQGAWPIEVTLLTTSDSDPSRLGDLYPVMKLHGCNRLPSLLALGPWQIVRAARAARLDLVHDPTGVAPFFGTNRVPGADWRRVVTIHDLIPLIFPEGYDRLTRFVFQHYLPKAITAVDRVIAISDSTRRDIHRFYPHYRRSIEPISLGVDAHFNPMADDRAVELVRQRYGLEPGYILAVGDLRPRKNLATLVDAYTSIRSLGFAGRLVIVGQSGWKHLGQPEARPNEEEDQDNGVTLTGYVNDDDLPALYRAARVFVYPSLYEGFGLPPLEAMACGTPVIASNSSSLPQVVGRAAITVDPLDTQELAAAIESIVASSSLHEDLRRRGLQRAQQFTWSSCAERTAQLYFDVSGS